MSKEKAEGWIDFKAVKELATVEMVLIGFELINALERKGEEWVGFCPFHPDKGKSDSFHFSESKKAFHCFCCKKKGSILDFVHQYMTYKGESVGLREAADWIQFQMREAEYRQIKARRAEKDRQDLGEHDAEEIAEASGGAPVIMDAAGVFVDFAEACRLVTFGQAHVQDFVAVRVEKLLEIFGELSPRKQAAKRDQERKRR